jgi:hypothetical protein
MQDLLIVLSKYFPGLRPTYAPICLLQNTQTQNFAIQAWVPAGGRGPSQAPSPLAFWRKIKI